MKFNIKNRPQIINSKGEKIPTYLDIWFEGFEKELQEKTFCIFQLMDCGKNCGYDWQKCPSKNLQCKQILAVDLKEILGETW